MTKGGSNFAAVVGKVVDVGEDRRVHEHATADGQRSSLHSNLWRVIKGSQHTMHFAYHFSVQQHERQAEPGDDEKGSDKVPSLDSSRTEIVQLDTHVLTYIIRLIKKKRAL